MFEKSIVITIVLLLVIQVSWLWRRSKDAVPILLTFGETVYVKDARISIRESCNEDLKHNNENSKTAFQYEGTCDWTLALMHSKLSDGGTYECHISTEPPQILKTNLLVQGKQGVEHLR